MQKLHSISVGVATLLLAGCATAPGAPQSPIGLLKNTFASDDPCSNNARNIGIGIGVVAGAVLGNAIGNGSDSSRLIGATVGGVVGGLIGADMDRKRCELSKVAKKYALEITFADIRADISTSPADAASSDVATRSAQTTTSDELIGNTVTVRDKEGAAGHFEPGSDRLTAKAREYFAAIAEQYAPDTLLATQTDPKLREEARKQLQQRHLLLVGHTDDTGSSQLNASLSERRARAVAAFLRQKGVPEGQIYYQGAGETLPIADNHSEAGRAVNRRVEIVEVANESGFKKYLENRKPQYSFYRTETALSTPATSTTDTVVKTAASDHEKAKKPKQVKTAEPKPAAQTAVVTRSTETPKTAAPTAPNVAQTNTKGPSSTNLDFGGQPYSGSVARINTGLLVPEKSFGLISTAYANDSVLTADCSQDRPRNAGQVKSLRDGAAYYKTSEYLPQLYGKTWASNVNGNLVVINRLAVLRDGTTPSNLPELKVYGQYKPGVSKKPDLFDEPQVNSYRVEKGVLYRMFPRQARGVQCMDILFALDGSGTARAGKLIHSKTDGRYVTDFNPKIQ